jgi:type I restriction enzyme, R subunit
MQIASERNMNEAETRAELIDSTVQAAGWGVIEGSRIHREVIALAHLIGNGKRTQSDSSFVVFF